MEVKQRILKRSLASRLFPGILCPSAEPATVCAHTTVHARPLMSNVHDINFRQLVYLAETLHGSGEAAPLSKTSWVTGHPRTLMMLLRRHSMYRFVTSK